MRLKDKVILVTASTRGIGNAIVQACAKEGAVVYMGARRMDFANDLAKKYQAEGMNVKTVYNDAYDHESYRTMIAQVVKEEGRLDVLVNNFGTSDPKKDKNIEETDFSDFIGTIDTNLASVYITCQEAVKVMAKNGGGSIINISSIGGVVPDISQIAYGTSKAAINYLTKLVAVQEGRNNIRCNAICPGMTATDAVKDSLSDEFKEYFLRHIPIKRMGTPKEIADLAVYFASDESSYTTGQIVEVSGGFGLPTPIYADALSCSKER